MMNDRSDIDYSCPIIDRIKRLLEGIEWEGQNEIALEVECNVILHLLEDIRTIADSLRKWGNEMHQDAEEYKTKYCALEDDLDIAIDQIKELQSTIRNLENEIQHLESI